MDAYAVVAKAIGTTPEEVRGLLFSNKKRILSLLMDEKRLTRETKTNLQQAINYLKAGRYETALEILEDVERTL